MSERRDGTRRLYRIDLRGLTELRAYFDGFWTRALADFNEAADHDERGEAS